MSTINNPPVRLCEFSRLVTLDAWFSTDAFRADYGYNGSQPLISLSLSAHGIDLDLLAPEIHFRTGHVEIMARRQRVCRIPRGLLPELGSAMDQARNSDRNTSAAWLLDLARRQIEAPDDSWLLRGDKALEARFHDAFSLINRQFETRTFISPTDNYNLMEDPAIMPAMAIGTTWFHPVQWRPQISDGVLEHVPVKRVFLSSRRREGLSAHDMLAELSWIQTFLREAGKDLGLSGSVVDAALAELFPLPG